MKVGLTSAFFLSVQLPLFALFAACSSGSISTAQYTNLIKDSVIQYNSARDIVDSVIRDLDYALVPTNPAAFLDQRVTELERAILEMNAASRSYGQQSFSPKFQPHQSATLRAWRSGIEAAVLIKLTIETVRDSPNGFKSVLLSQMHASAQVVLVL